LYGHFDLFTAWAAFAEDAKGIEGRVLPPPKCTDSETEKQFAAPQKENRQENGG